MVELRKPGGVLHLGRYYYVSTYISPMATAASRSAFSSAHRLYVKSLYKRYLTNALDWTINRDIWRWQAMQIRAEFEKNR